MKKGLKSCNIARATQNGRKGEQKSSQQENDYALALAMQNELLQEQQDLVKEDFQVWISNTSIAWNFVESVLDLQRRLLEPPVDPDVNYCNFSSVAVDDMLVQVEHFLDKLDEFRRAEKPSHVDIGYHYTHRNNMANIKTDGLLSKAERQASSIKSCFNGATFGDGIYTASNPFAYHGFAGGEIGLFVLRLKGQAERFETSTQLTLDDADTILGRNATDEVTVLRSSSQCVALVQFPSELVSITTDDTPGNKMVYKYHCLLQELVDKHLNFPEKTQVQELLPSQVSLRAAAGCPVPAVAQGSKSTLVSSSKLIRYSAPDTLATSGRTQFVREVDPATASATECAICLAGFHRGGAPMSFLSTCFHEFHLQCIQTALEHSNKCPVCRKPVGKPVGKMPSGTMLVEHRHDLVCSGHAPGAIVLTYNLVGGIQKYYHENPGVAHASTSRVAYLPDNDEGRQLLKRLEYAFRCGLTFTVGTSLTTGVANSVTWSAIHHKTCISGGMHGFPDPSYFFNANEELDTLDIPAAEDL